MSFVLDSSVALAWCFEDEQSALASNVLDLLTETGAVAPQLWPLEVMNGLLMAERRRRFDSTRRLEMVSFLRQLPVVLDAQSAELAWTRTGPMAAEFSLTLYDAAYLELAHRRRLALATFDKELRAAAMTLGVALV